MPSRPCTPTTRKATWLPKNKCFGLVDAACYLEGYCLNIFIMAFSIISSDFSCWSGSMLAWATPRHLSFFAERSLVDQHGVTPVPYGARVALVPPGAIQTRHGVDIDVI